MKYRTIIGRLFAILVIAGLVSGPGVKPSFAAEPAGMMAHTMMMDDGSAIAAPDEDMSAMPCCPSQTKKAPDSGSCDKCMMMSCSMTCFTEPVTAVSWNFALSRVSMTALKNDRLLQGLGHSPPDQPPRI